MSSQDLDQELRREAQEWAAQLRLPDPEFDFVIAWPKDYEELFARDGHRTTADALLDEALLAGRVLLHGEGGTGKTSIARRMFKRALERHLLPVFIDIRRWDAPANAEWEAHKGNEVSRMDVLFRRLACPGAQEEQLARVSASRSCLVIVDGLNEAPEPVPNEILTSVDGFARRNPHAGVLVTDRVVRRRRPSESWALASIQEARLVDPDDHLTSGSSLMRTAFFLDLALKEGLDSTSSSKAFRAYFDRHASLQNKGLARVAHAAYEAYRTTESRTFSFREFRADAGHSYTERLLHARVLQRDNGNAYFRHHLFHDFLAGVWLAADRRRWRSGLFDLLTFRASSFDVLALALEEIEPAEAADAFLRRIYDWNYYGSAYALAKGRSLGTVAATESMEVALLAMLAERRWDLLLATAQRVEDALRLFPGPMASNFLAAADLEEVIAIVNNHALTEPFEEWRQLFTTSPGSKVPDAVVEELASSESLMGWTTANVLKRVSLTAAQRSRVRDLLTRGNEIVRWRAAHVLGSLPERQSAEALFDALVDRDRWVRYGAVRSLVELAARDDRLRERVLSRLREVIGDIAADPKVLGEFERAILLQSPPPDWVDAVAPIIEQLWGTAESLEEQDHWRHVALRVRRQTIEA